MNSVKRIAINTISLSLSELVVKISQFIIFVFVARTLGKEIFGKFNFAYSFSIIAVLFMDMGINYMLIRDIAKNRDSANKFLINSFFIKFFLSIISYIFIYFILNLTNYPADTKNIVYLMVLFAFIKSFSELLFSVFKGYEVMHYEAMLKMIRMVSILAFGLFILRTYKNASLLALTFVIIEVIIFLISFFLVLRMVKMRYAIDYEFSKKILKDALPFSLSMIFASIYFYIDTLMLSFIHGDTAVGIYSAAYNITLAILFIPGMYVFAIYPVISKNFTDFAEKVELIYQRSMKYMLIIGLPVTLGFFFLADKIIYFLYGYEFSASVPVLKLLSWFVFIKFVSFITGIMLSVNRQYLRALSQGLTAFLNIFLNVLLIPKYSYFGAAIATITSEVSLFALSYFFVSRNINKFNILKILPKPVIASAIMAVVVFYLNINFIAVIFLAGIVYFLALFLLKAFDEKDFSLLRNIISEK